eukprot:SAG31_NODE_5295_length_2627_cov_2.101266_1_plen_171_part_00
MASGELVAVTAPPPAGAAETAALVPGYAAKSQSGGSKLRAALDSSVWSALVVAGTIWALYSSDFTFLVLPKSADATVAVISIFITTMFGLEIILNFVAKRDYGKEAGFDKLNLFFWLDIFGTASLIPEILVSFAGDRLDPNRSSARVLRRRRRARAPVLRSRGFVVFNPP